MEQHELKLKKRTILQTDLPTKLQIVAKLHNCNAYCFVHTTGQRKTTETAFVCQFCQSD